jgi:flagellar basal-body rod protein FlgB
MDWSTTEPFGILKQRLDWLDQRQQVLARNIANSDTPGFTPKDVEPLRFRAALRGALAPVQVAATAPNHLSGTLPAATGWKERGDRHPVEATPNGNAVDLEEQMARLNEVGASHRLTTQLYRKYLGMIRTAAGARG